MSVAASPRALRAPCSGTGCVSYTPPCGKVPDTGAPGRSYFGANVQPAARNATVAAIKVCLSILVSFLARTIRRSAARRIMRMVLVVVLERLVRIFLLAAEAAAD